MTTNTIYPRVSILSHLCQLREPIQNLNWQLEGAIPKTKTRQRYAADEE